MQSKVNLSPAELFDSLTPIQRKIVWLMRNEAQTTLHIHPWLFTNDAEECYKGRLYDEKIIVQHFIKDSNPYANTLYRIKNQEFKEYLQSIPGDKVFDRQQVLEYSKATIKNLINTQLENISKTEVFAMDVGYLKSVYNDAIEEATENLGN